MSSQILSTRTIWAHALDRTLSGWHRAGSLFGLPRGSARAASTRAPAAPNSATGSSLLDLRRVSGRQPVVVEDVSEHAPGVQIDAAVKSVRLVVEAHRVVLGGDGPESPT